MVEPIVIGESKEAIEKVVRISRVAKVTKGGKKMSFSALVVVGNTRGRVGVALGKANEVSDAIRKGISQAKKAMMSIPMEGTSIPHDVVGKFGSARVMLKPAVEGTGIIASGPVRAVCEAAGIKDILTKCITSNNPMNVIMATMEGFKQLNNELEIFSLRRQSSNSEGTEDVHN
ncbi:MAG TPA: 30S ribosomal protein S5 [Candidatus Omnitrophota bacterium]|nr:30S ribosomal protein S5 [Candidatus Omnitrophota bacterium]